MRQLKKYLLAMVCVLAIGGLTGCGRRGNEVTTESTNDGKRMETQRETEKRSNETEKMTDSTERMTKKETERGSEGALEELGEDVKRGVENIGDDLLGTERGTDSMTERAAETEMKSTAE